MSKKKTEKGVIVQEYVIKYRTVPSRTIAKMLIDNRPDLFSDIETARSLIRYYRGSTGDASRDTVSESFPQLLEQPEPWEEPWEPYKLPKGNNKVLVLSDIHVPFHDPVAVDIALEYGMKRGMNTILVNGDGFDCYAISRFVKDPRLRSFDREVDEGRNFVKFLKSYGKDIIWKQGNHEERLEIALRSKMSDLAKLDDFKVENLYRLTQNGIPYVRDKRPIEIGKLNILHGHELNGWNPVSPARNALLKTKENILIGHNHKTSIQPSKNIKGKFHFGWSQGCLCNLSPQYAVINEWNLGFAFVEVTDDEGNFTLDNKMIIDNTVR